jgi:hypothetical protein
LPAAAVLPACQLDMCRPRCAGVQVSLPAGHSLSREWVPGPMCAAGTSHLPTAGAVLTPAAVLPAWHRLGTRFVTVSWAEPKRSDAAPEALQQVKSIYVGGIPADADTEKLSQIFSKYGDVEKVRGGGVCCVRHVCFVCAVCAVQCVGCPRHPLCAVRCAL